MFLRGSVAQSFPVLFSGQCWRTKISGNRHQEKSTGWIFRPNSTSRRGRSAFWNGKFETLSKYEKIQSTDQSFLILKKKISKIKTATWKFWKIKRFVDEQIQIVNNVKNIFTLKNVNRSRQSVLTNRWCSERFTS